MGGGVSKGKKANLIKTEQHFKSCNNPFETPCTLNKAESEHNPL